jgi:hypothetical protein
MKKIIRECIIYVGIVLFIIFLFIYGDKNIERLFNKIIEERFKL